MQSQRYFYQGSSKLYREFYPYNASLDRPNGYLWSFEEATMATLSMYGLPGAAKTYASAIQDRFTAREKYWDQSLTAVRAYRSYPATGDRYYDDNCWTGADLLQHHLFTARGIHEHRARSCQVGVQLHFRPVGRRTCQTRAVSAGWTPRTTVTARPTPLPAGRNSAPTCTTQPDATDSSLPRYRNPGLHLAQDVPAGWQWPVRQ